MLPRMHCDLSSKMASAEEETTELKCANPEIFYQEQKENKKDTDLKGIQNKDSSAEDEKGENEVNNSSDEESDRFEDALEDMNLNQKISDKNGQEGTVENNIEEEDIDEYLEPEEPLSEEQKQVDQISYFTYLLWIDFTSVSTING